MNRISMSRSRSSVVAVRPAEDALTNRSFLTRMAFCGDCETLVKVSVFGTVGATNTIGFVEERSRNNVTSANRFSACYAQFVRFIARMKKFETNVTVCKMSVHLEKPSAFFTKNTSAFGKATQMICALTCLERSMIVTFIVELIQN
jgi:hypothetical protein